MRRRNNRDTLLSRILIIDRNGPNKINKLKGQMESAL